MVLSSLFIESVFKNSTMRMIFFFSNFDSDPLWVSTPESKLSEVSLNYQEKDTKAYSREEYGFWVQFSCWLFDLCASDPGTMS